MILMMIAEALDVDDPKVEQYPPTPLNGKWGFAEVYQSWIGLPDGILPLSSSSSTEPGVHMTFYAHHFQMALFPSSSVIFLLYRLLAHTEFVSPSTNVKCV